MRINLLIISMICVLSLRGSCQQPEATAVASPPFSERPLPRSAVIEFMAAQLLPITYDRYIAGKDYAKISFQTIGDHLSPSSWAWDNDGFQTNQIGHPYHGNIFFNSFRGNGYSFSQSALASFSGSLIWEIAAENQAPAPNDLINTSFGGIVLGETTHRLADRLRQTRSSGIKRQLNEILALLVDPAGGFSRLLDGRWARWSPSRSGRDSLPMTLQLDIGFRKYNINDQNPFHNGRLGWYGRLHFELGSPSVNRKIPFNHFSILVEGGKDDSSRINIVSAYGSLYGWRSQFFGLSADCSISANYEYINNQAFFFSGQSIRVNLYKDFQVSPEVRISATLAAGPVLLAAVPDGYLYENRDYDYGPGFAANGGLRLSIGPRIQLRSGFRVGYMKTISGNRSNYFLHVFTNEVDLLIFRNLSIGAEEGYFSLHGHYAEFPNVNKGYPYIRMAIKYKFPI